MLLPTSTLWWVLVLLGLPGSFTVARASAVFTYDESGTRIKKSEEGAGGVYPFGDHTEVVGGVVTKYVSLGGELVAKRTGTATSWIVTTTRAPFGQ
jgi:hypothetical protein